MQKIKFLISKGLRKFLNPPAIRDSRIDKTAAVWDHTSINNSTLGKYSYVSDHTVISHAQIGNFCSISSFCMIGGAGHPVDFASTSPVFLVGRNAMGTHFAEIAYEPYEKIVIGNDVWIGTHCLIKSGVTIGDGAVVGMGSVVTKDIGPYEIWAGNPARLIRKRFSEETAQALQNSRWWELPDEVLADIGRNGQDPVEFAKLAAEFHR